jgi:hypothetical protein
MKLVTYALMVAALGLGAASTPAAEQPAAAGPEVYAAAAKYAFGQSRAPLTAIEAEIRAASPAQYKAIEAKLLPLVKSPDTAVDAKRYFCRYLGVVGSAESVAALAALLGDEKLSGPARIALEPMRDPAAGAALRAALGQVKGKLLAGVIGSVGMRRDGQAVAALAGLTGDADADVAKSTIAALGAIGTSDAAKALDDAAAKAPETLQPGVAQARLTCAAGLAQSGKSAEATAIYRSLLAAKAAPATRPATLRGLVALQTRLDALKTIADALQGDDAAMRAAAIGAFVGAGDPSLKASVAEQLPTLNATGQKALLAVLPDQRDVHARPGLLKLIEESKDEAIRADAVECLGAHGQAEDVAMLSGLATKDGGGPEAAAARKALERMVGPGVSEAIVRLMASPDAPARNMAIALVTSRRIETATPALVKMIGGADAAAAGNAVKSLALLGGPGELPGLMKILVNTTDDGLRTTVEAAVASICTRTTDRSACARAVLPAMISAISPASRMAVLRLLPRVRTPEALATAQRAMREEANPEILQAAIRAVSDWPDISAAQTLLDYAKAAKNPSDAVLAMRGCLRLADLKDQPPAQRLAVYRSVLEAAQRPEEKKQALAGLADLPSPDALDVLVKYVKDPAVGADAAQAAMRLARQIGAGFRQRAEAALQQVKANAPTEEIRQAADATIKNLARTGQTPDGYILAWMLSGPYTQEGKSGAELCDVAFAPEKPGAQAEWRFQGVPADAKTRGLVELNVILGGNERIAYLRTEILSPKAQEAVLELGSDDGAKVWVNGQQVLSKNVVRPYSPGEDKVKISLKQGANTLLLKVIQGGGEWSAAARLTAADGKALDFTVAPNSK